MANIKHTGVLGMRWGVRRVSKSSGPSLGSRLKAHYARSVLQKTGVDITVPNSSDHKTASTLKKKKLSQLTNDELKTLTTRLQLEKQYRDLVKGDSGAGKKFIGEVMSGVGKQLATKYIANIGDKGINIVADLLKKHD